MFDVSDRARALVGFSLMFIGIGRTFGGETKPKPQPPPARIPTYTVRDLGVLDGYMQSWPTGLNDAGDAVGYASRWTITPGGLLVEDQACLFKDGQVFSLGVSSSNSRANAINNHGQIVGQSGGAFAFLWDNGTITWLGSLIPNGLSEANDINDLGQVVGWSSTIGPDDHPFLWQNGVMVDLGNLGKGDSVATAINELGQVVGNFGEAHTQQTHAFLWQNGTLAELHGIENTSAVATAINDEGDIVGYVTGYAIIWQNQIPAFLENPPCFVCGFPLALRNFDQIVGVVGSPTGSRALIWYYGMRFEIRPLIDPNSPFKTEVAVTVNASGQVLCRGQGPSPQVFYALLLTPINCDVNGDGEISTDDFQGLPNCLLGPESEAAPLCGPVDFDGDLDVDLVDYRSFDLAFQRP